MANRLVINEGPVYTVDNILQILEDNNSLHYFHSNWRVMAHRMQVDNAEIQRIHTGYLIGTRESLRVCVHEILEAWVLVASQSATVEALVNILDQLSMKLCWEHIVAGFNLVAIRRNDGTLTVAPNMEPAGPAVAVAVAQLLAGQQVEENREDEEYDLR